MSAVYTRSRRVRRPSYLPTAVQERLNRPVLPSDAIHPNERRRLEARGIDRDFLDTLVPDVIRVRMTLPAEPVPPTPIRTYKPDA